MTEWAGLVVVDDLTGGMDTGHAFAKNGHRTVVSLGRSRPTAGTVHVYDTDSRYVAPDEAADRVRTVISDQPAAVYYKKVDSTLRGNLVAEIDAALAAADATIGVIAPAFPATDRRTACGYHLADGELVTATPAGTDPDKPVSSAHLGELLADSRYPVEHVGIETVAQGPPAVRTATAGATEGHVDPTLVTFDATHDAHLADIATGVAELDADPLWVGSAGLAAHVPMSQATDSPVTGPTQGDRVLGIVGSTHPRTLEALAAVPEDQLVTLDAATAVAAPERAASRTVAAVRDAFADTTMLVVTSVQEKADVDAGLAAAETAGVPEPVARERIAHALALTAAELYADASPCPNALFLTGGAVARAVLEALDTTAIELTGRAVASGIPLGRTKGGIADGIPVVTKAGGFGTGTTIMGCLSHLQTDE